MVPGLCIAGSKANRLLMAVEFQVVGVRQAGRDSQCLDRDEPCHSKQHRERLPNLSDHFRGAVVASWVVPGEQTTLQLFARRADEVQESKTHHR